ERRRESARSSGIVGPVHDHGRIALEDLETARPLDAREPEADGLLGSAELAGGGRREERVARLEYAEQSTADVLEVPAGSVEIQAMAVEGGGPRGDVEVAPREDERDADLGRAPGQHLFRLGLLQGRE